MKDICPVNSFLFHKPDFVFRDSSPHVTTFEVAEKNIKTLIYFSIQEKTLVSFPKSPFGGFVYDAFEENQIADLTEQSLRFACENQLKEIIIKCCPEIYSSDQIQIHALLQYQKFKISFKDISQLIRVSDIPLQLNTHRKRRLRKCISDGFTFRKLKSTQLVDAYTLFVESRQSKSYPVTMSYDDLLLMFEKFPNNYFLFGVFHGDIIVAASVSIAINLDILYCFYLGDALRYRSYSPVTFLVNEIYNYAAINKFKVIDLGISTDKGILNEGLYNFKKSLGAFDSDKLTFEIKL